MYNKRKIGQEQEEICAKYLIEKGYQIIEKNFYCRTGEIDIIAMDNEYLVFIEVKYRESTKNGYPVEAVDYRKIKSIIKAANYYLLSHGYMEDTPCRFDVIVVLKDQIELIQDAFEV